MANVTCPVCAAALPDDAERLICRRCGTPLDARQPPARRIHLKLQSQPVPTPRSESRRAGAGRAPRLTAIVDALGVRMIVSLGLLLFAIAAAVWFWNRDDGGIDHQDRAGEQGAQRQHAGARTGEKSIFDLRAGDCVVNFGSSEAGKVVEEDRVTLVECNDERAQLRVTRLALVESDSVDYPGERFLDDFSLNSCGAESTSFLFPTEQSWEQGDRTITCLVDT